MIRFSSFAALFILFHASVFAAEGTPDFECRYAAGKIVIDGEAKEEAWQEAPAIDRFTLPWLRENERPAKTATKARLLWDRENLYFFAEMEDADLYADVTEHDGKTWENDVFELFFKPADKPGYYEFQVNAAGTVMDMLIPRRNAGGYQRFIADGDFGIEAKVSLRGTLNRWSDKDEGWSVEGRIPWRGFLRTGGRPEPGETWKFALCRYDYSVDFEGPELSTCAPLKSKSFPDFHLFEDYAKLKFLGPDRAGEKENTALSRLRQLVGKTPSRVIGSPEPPPPYRAVRVLPKLALSWPIYILKEPTSRRFLFIDQQYSYGPARLCRTSDDSASGEYDTLFEFPEKGLATSLCFHPNYAENGYVYVGWNGAPGGGEKRSMVTRYTIGREPPHQLDPDSATTIIEWPSDGHNGVAVAFGLDGMFYVTSGDGTSDSDTNVKGQGLDHLLAKLLRIDVNHPDAGREYSIPRDNPFVGIENVRPETYAYGFRNPWRIEVDQQTGAVWVGNNGQDLWEQAFLIERGANYGWSVYEGSHLFYPNRQLGPTPVSKPAVEHSHSDFRSLTGGVVYYGKRFPDLRGVYIYGDYSTGKIWGAKADGSKIVWNEELADTTLAISCFAIDADGELLIADHRGDGQGGFYTLEPNPATGSHEDFPRTLSESGLFASVAEHRLHEGLIPYSVNSPLWSDGAHKERFIHLPADDGKGGPAKIDVTANRGWNFPDRTVLVKSFALEMEEDAPESRRWIETRFLTKQDGEWVGYSYVWNDEQTEAALVGKDGLDRTFAVRTPEGTREQKWRYPSRTECMVCHSRAANFVLGLSTLQMNKENQYGGGAVNQLELLESLGVLRLNPTADIQAALREELKKTAGSEKEAQTAFEHLTATRDQRSAAGSSSLLPHSPSKMPRLVDPYDAGEDLTARARSYLHANCSQCHVEAGGGNAQMDLEFTTSLEKMKAIDVAPLHHKYGIDDPKLIAPGDPERSVLLRRISHRGEGQMPQLATTVVDAQAVELLREWIMQLGADTR